ncbi:unnamed protein product [Cylindrotheca closterium]|uniref:Uncharacterized protein n=1 Tax=Cylindrotheca closterium TaxID=2856 RepID=A0AAD2FSV6_9STRA|nr:unnamed protein product [Cylindrotheca closterium]
MEYTEEEPSKVFLYKQDAEDLPSDIMSLVTDVSVRVFRKQALRYFHALEEVEFSEGLEEIEASAFFDCRALRKVSIPSTVKCTGKRSFHRCTNLVDVQLKEGLVSIENSAFGVCTELGTMRLPSSVAIIEQSAFGHCRSLVSIELQEGLQFIGIQAFQSCTSLKEIDIPSTVVKIEWGAFRDCHQLSRVGLKVGLLGQLDADTFARCYRLPSISLPSSIESIESSFFNCRSLVDVRLAEGLKTCLDRSFEDCTALKAVNLPSTLEEIGKRAFSGCVTLSQINLPKGLVRIRTKAFFDCSSLPAISLPTSLEVIEKLAFGHCFSLLGVEFPNGSNVQLQGAVFYKCARLVNLSIPPLVEHVVTAEDLLFLGCERLQDLAGDRSLRDRFKDLPLHQACYSSSTTTLEDLVKQLGLCCDQITKDAFGMTPFHIVATSSNPRTEILGALLEKYSVEAFYHKDTHGTTMMDYMLIHQSPKIVPLIKMVLQRTTLPAISGWGLDRCKSIILQQIEDDFPGDNVHALQKIRDQLIIFSKLEMTSLLELSLWKMKKKSMITSPKEVSRLLCGANAVMPQVIGYLWDSSVPYDELPSSMFPFNISE